MKSTFILSALLLVSSASMAQSAREFRPFKVDLLTGYSLPISSNGLKGGINFSVEPKYHITDQIAAGIQFGISVLASETSGDDFVAVGLTSTSLTGEYYFGTKNVRPYAGIGLGPYRVFAFSSDEDDADVIGERVFGFAPRVGLQLSHFRLGAEYHLVRGLNQLSIKLGGTFGGGRKK